MNRIAALTLAGIVALGTVAFTTASHETPAPVKPASEWQVPSSVATVSLVPSDNIAPDKSYSGYQGPSATCQEDQPCWNCHEMGNRICGPVAAPVAAIGTPAPVTPAPVPTVIPVQTIVIPTLAPSPTPSSVACSATR